MFTVLIKWNPNMKFPRDPLHLENIIDVTEGVHGMICFKKAKGNHLIASRLIDEIKLEINNV